MTLRRRPRRCEHHAIHGTRCLDCHATVTVPAWYHGCHSRVGFTAPGVS